MLVGVAPGCRSTYLFIVEGRAVRNELFCKSRVTRLLLLERQSATIILLC
jgi:hypothetical protein